MKLKIVLTGEKMFSLILASCVKMRYHFVTGLVRITHPLGVFLHKIQAGNLIGTALSLVEGAVFFCARPAALLSGVGLNPSIKNQAISAVRQVGDWSIERYGRMGFALPRCKQKLLRGQISLKSFLLIKAFKSTAPRRLGIGRAIKCRTLAADDWTEGTSRPLHPCEVDVDDVGVCAFDLRG